MKKLITICAAALALAAIAADTDCGALITTGNIADSAKVENLTGANAGKATITINNNSGTAQAVTVYNVATIDAAISGMADASDVAALETRATALETATNTLNAAVGDIGSIFVLDESRRIISIDSYRVLWGSGGYIEYTADGFKFYHPSVHGLPASDYTLAFPFKGGTFATLADIPSSWDYTAITNAPWLTSFTETDPVWSAAKGSYSTTSQMNTAITSATNGLAKASALSGYVPTSRKVAGKALTSDVTLSNLSIVGSSTTTYNGSAAASVNQTTQTQTATTQGGTTGKNLTIQVAATSLDMGAYYIKIGSDGKPHLMLRQ